jgi:NAD(P)-dependent dehydrogenase (short-subunit alcohol dehydrogenase family)
MAVTNSKVLVVVAAGPLISNATAILFASRGFSHIALLSRNIKRLQKEVSQVLAAASDSNKDVVVKAYAGDVASPASLMHALKQIEADFGAPEVVLYNGSRISGASISAWDELTEEDLVDQFKVSILWR